MSRPQSQFNCTDAEMRISLSHLAEQARSLGDPSIESMLRAAVAMLDTRLDSLWCKTTKGLSGPPISTDLICRGVRVGKQARSVAVEEEFWQATEHLADHFRITVDALCDRASALIENGDDLASALRVLVLRELIAMNKDKNNAT